MSEERRQCKAVNSRGERCKMIARRGTDYCKCHTRSPLAALMKIAAQIEAWKATAAAEVSKIYGGKDWRDKSPQELEQIRALVQLFASATDPSNGNSGSAS